LKRKRRQFRQVSVFADLIATFGLFEDECDRHGSSGRSRIESIAVIHCHNADQTHQFKHGSPDLQPCLQGLQLILRQTVSAQEQRNILTGPAWGWCC
jgi:hypothetical protein